MKNFLKPTVRAFTLLEMMIAMTLTGLIVLYGHQMFRTFDHSKETYLRAILHSLNLSRVINQTAYDFWHSYDLLPDAGSPDILIALADVQGLPQVHYLISDSALIRVEAERKDTLQGIKARVYPRAMTLYDSSRQFYQTFFLPERSFAILP